MQKPRSLGRAITRLVPPDCLAGLGKSVSYDGGRKERRGKKRTAIGNENEDAERGRVFLISRSLSSVPGRPRSRAFLSAATKKVRSALIIVNQTSGPPHRADQGGPELHKHNYC